MTLILVRHGAYLPKYVDPQEGLSEEGILEVKALLKKLQSQHISYDYVYSSPKTRAIETASILAKDTPIQQIDLLKPSSDPNNLYDYIQTLSGDCLLVGHNPLLSYLSSYFDHPMQFNTADHLIIASR